MMSSTTSTPSKRRPVIRALVAATLSTAFAGVSSASESHCYSIKDADQKNHCLALAKRKDSYCYSIRAQDGKNLCLAQTKGQKSYCYSIRSSDTKNQCLALAR